MSAPVVVLAGTGSPTEREMRSRYGTEYEIVCAESGAAARGVLNGLLTDGKEVALTVAALRLPDGRGEDLLAWTRELHGNIKRALLVSWDDDDARSRLLRAMSLGDTESWAYAPTAERDEQFHRTISELLEEWDRWSGIDPSEIVVIGPRMSQACQQVRDTLLRAGYPHRNCEVDSPEAEHILQGCAASVTDVPVVRLPNGRTLIKPSRAELAELFGVPTRAVRREYDIAIVGAGPAGLSAATYAASEGLKTVLIEQASMGGQAGSSALIRNYLGFPRGVSGPELASRAYQQAWLFGADLLYGAPVRSLRRDDAGLAISMANADELRVKAAVIATGVQYRQLGIPSVEALVGAGVFYGSAMSAATALVGEDVFVAGGGNSAGQAAVHLAKHDARVHMLVRGKSFAESMSAYLIGEIERSRNISVSFESEILEAHGSGRLEAITYNNAASGGRVMKPATAVFIFIGMAPHTEWLPDDIKRDQWGFIETGHAGGAEHSVLALQTSMGGVFAVGDVRQGSTKRVASAVGEGSICIAQVHDYLDGLVEAH